jgi:hypothetical protein
MKVPMGYLWKSLKEHASHLSELLVLDSNPQLSLQKNISNIDTSTCCPWDYCSRDVGRAIHQMCNMYHDTLRGAGNGCLPDVESSFDYCLSTLIVSLHYQSATSFGYAITPWPSPPYQLSLFLEACIDPVFFPSPWISTYYHQHSSHI